MGSLERRAYVSITEAAVSQGEATEPSLSRPAKGVISQEAVRGQLERILNSKAFARSPRISRFLSFVVEQTLDGQENKLKEYLLGVEVFGRLDSFDPRIDSIVRVEARRLRYKLERYYENEGPSDPVLIQFRKGCYIPAFAEKRAGEDGTDRELADVPYVRAIGNPQAFAHYARGRACLGRWTTDGIAEAISCFTRALDEESECAGAHAGLASAWILASFLGLMPSRDVLPKAKTEALQALEIAPHDSEALAISGMAAALFDQAWEEGEGKLRKAIHTNPCDLPARLWYGLYLTMAGRSEEGVKEARKAQQAAPTSVTAHLAVGFACHAGGAYDEALAQYRLAQDLHPGFYAPYLAMGLLFTDQGMFEQASHMLNRASQLSPRNPTVMAATAYCQAAGGHIEASRQSLVELSHLSERQFVSPMVQALACSAAGEIDQAFRKLEAAAEEHSVWLPVVAFAPAFERVRQDPRYESIRWTKPARPAVAEAV
jgi:tetratricopeptide (TPR) repeat protein